MVEGGRSAGQSGDTGVARVIRAEAFEEVLVELESATGTRQGDPSGGVLFALGHQQALRATAAAFPDCAFPSIADDTHIVGPPARVVEAFVNFFVQLALLGLEV